VMRACDIETFSDTSTAERCLNHEGLPSPVSIRIRLVPLPTRYVFVPDRVSLLATIDRKVDGALESEFGRITAQNPDD